jgi:hypothetical protein
MTMSLQTREERGRMIAEKPNQIQRLDERFYRVASRSRDLSYDVPRYGSYDHLLYDYARKYWPKLGSAQS